MRLAPLAVLPKGAVAILKELGRHILKRPVVGVAAAAHDGGTNGQRRWLLVQRADNGEWALPGGTLEWGETLRDSIGRELEEEAGVTSMTFERVAGVFSRPDRDPRFHGVTVAVVCRVPFTDPCVPRNPLEIRDARFFTEDELPPKLAFDMQDMLAAARDFGANAADVVFE